MTRDRLSSADAVLTLGALVVRSLQEHSVVVLFVALDGSIQVCPPEELQLDAFPEEDAIARLLERGYTEPDIISYLKCRLARQKPEASDG